MSEAQRIGKLFSLPKARSESLLNNAGRAGPRRLAAIVLGSMVIFGLVVVVATSGRKAQLVSQDARMKSVNALPGGLYSTPEQDALAREADQHQAQAALGKGTSYTPPMAPSVAVLPPSPKVEQATPAAAPPPQPRFVGKPAPVYPQPVRVAFPMDVPAQPTDAGGPARVIPVQAVVDPNAVQVYNKQIGDLFIQWGGRAPRTDVVMPASEQGGNSAAIFADSRAATATMRGSATPTSVSSRPDDVSPQVLIPAGRGVYAHPVLALSSDQTSPVVMQADIGPIAGDRMIGSFARQNDRLVIYIGSIIHDGEPLSADGVVIAPDTMEAAVATGVDQHYLTRFILPAAAAFVQGLGQALATTSNTVSVLSPLGGATTATNLNFHQQLGVAAGVAAGQIGSTLNQAAPKGPTVSLEANVSVGVMFMSNVTTHRQD